MNFALSIGADGYFLARPEVIGSTAEEVGAIYAGSHVEPDRISMLRNAIVAAAEKLRVAAPAGSC